jgi:hypothetical protein
MHASSKPHFFPYRTSPRCTETMPWLDVECRQTEWSAQWSGLREKLKSKNVLFVKAPLWDILVSFLLWVSPMEALVNKVREGCKEARTMTGARLSIRGSDVLDKVAENVMQLQDLIMNIDGIQVWLWALALGSDWSPDTGCELASMMTGPNYGLGPLIKFMVEWLKWLSDTDEIDPILACCAKWTSRKLRDLTVVVVARGVIMMPGQSVPDREVFLDMLERFFATGPLDKTFRALLLLGFHKYLDKSYGPTNFFGGPGLPNYGPRPRRRRHL